MDGLIRDRAVDLDVPSSAYRVLHVLHGRVGIGTGARSLRAHDTLLILPSLRVRRLPLEVAGAAVTMLVAPSGPA